MRRVGTRATATTSVKGRSRSAQPLSFAVKRVESGGEGRCRSHLLRKEVNDDESEVAAKGKGSIFR